MEVIEQVNERTEGGDDQGLAEGEGPHTPPTGRVEHDQTLYQKEAPDEGGVGAWGGRGRGKGSEWLRVDGCDDKEEGRGGEKTYLRRRGCGSSHWT